MIIFLATIIIILLLLDYYLFNLPKGTNEFNKVPGAKRIPFIGNLLDASTPIKLFYQARKFANLCRNNDNISRAVILHNKLINMYDPDDIEVLLSSPKYIQKGFVYMFLHSWLNDGLLTSKGEKWQKRRKILTPTFHFNILRQFCKVFVEQSDGLVKKLQKEVGKEETEILPLITDFAINTISETAMGTNLDSSQNIVIRYKKAIYDMGDVLVRRFTRFWLHIPIIYKFSSTGKEENRILSFLHGFTTSVIRERRLTRSEEENNVEVDDLNEDKALGMKKRLAMLDLLLKAESEGQIDEKGIREEVDTFMFEGHDTTTMAIVFTLMLIANHPEIQERIVEEVNEVLGDSKQPTIEDFNKLSYLEMCIKESLRLYPSVPFISRQLTEEMPLKKYTIPAGTCVFLHIYDVHRNPELYPDPDKYDPERFSPENSRKRHPYAYIPFSAGPRNCIGQRFALLEEKAVISAILRMYKLEPVTRQEDIIFQCDAILRCRDPVKVKFVNRIN